MENTFQNTFLSEEVIIKHYLALFSVCVCVCVGGGLITRFFFLFGFQVDGPITKGPISGGTYN